MPILYCDLETFCEVPITHGTHRYAEAAEVLMLAYAWDDDDVSVFEGLPGNAQEMFDAADEVVFHNQTFDRNVLKHQGVIVPVEKITCTMVLALSHGYPASLDQLCQALEIPLNLAKKKEGKKYINLFCKPRPKKQKLRRATKLTHPEEWAGFLDYAGHDITSMRVAYKMLPRWNYQPFERKLWYLDQKINDRGVAIDLELAKCALRAAERAGKALADEAEEITDGAVKSTTQRDVLMAYLNDQLDAGITDLKKGTLKNLIKKGLVTEEVKEILENRLQAAATSPAKYKVLLRSTSLADGRLRGTLQFCGAGRTSRWGGRLFQPQNLPRPTLEHKMIELGILAMKANCEDLIFDNVMELCASAVRGGIVAPDGKKLRISDLSNIEGRVSAWLAGEEWKVKAFAELDAGRGVDIYVLAYARAFGVSVETVIANKKNGDGMMRQIGKVMELALGYGGAVGAFASMALLYGIELPEDEIVDIVQKWRKAHPAIKKYWYDLEWAIRQAFRNPGESFKAGLVSADRVGHTLRLKMPSGSYLCYPHFDEEDGKCSYMGINQYTRRWERISSYGPKFFENCLAAGTQVLTGRGWVNIEDVRKTDLVHDGVDLVEHGGSIFKSVQKCQSIDGVWMTPDHEVLTEKGWRRAETNPEPFRPNLWGAYLYEIRGLGRKEDVLEIPLSVQEDCCEGRDRRKAGNETRWHAKLRLHDTSVDRCWQHEAWHECAPSIRRVARYAGSLPSSLTQGLEKLRRSWNKSLCALAGIVSKFLGRHGADIPDRADHRTCQQQQGLFKEKLCVENLQSTGEQQARQHHDLYTHGMYDGVAGVREIQNRQNHHTLSDKERLADKSSIGSATQREALVYDILNCGPRHRFVVRGLSGPFIVHNCVQKISRDILARGMIKAEEAGFEMVLHVHDELVAESGEDDEELDDKYLSKLLATNPPWALGLPLAAAGHSTSRYAKE